MIHIVVGDARSLPFADGIAQTCVTSPPYWRQRDYGVAGQIGQESTPEEYVDNLVQAMREVWRVLRLDGTLWINLGDAYANDSKWGGRTGGKHRAGLHGTPVGRLRVRTGYPPKCLMGLPWRVAFALIDDGWTLRRDIVWHKPSVTPESVDDRPTTAHEYVFLLSKQERYVYNAEAIAEPLAAATAERAKYGWKGRTEDNSNGARTGGSFAKLAAGALFGESALVPASGLRNARSVWSIAAEGITDAHYASMPSELARRCILAGSLPTGGYEPDDVILSPTGAGDRDDDPSITTGRAGLNRPRRANEGTRPMSRGEQAEYARQLLARYAWDAAAMEAEVPKTTLVHYMRTDRAGARAIPPRLLERWIQRGWLTEATSAPAFASASRSVVLDPFMGSGTTAMVALQCGRHAIGVDLSGEYQRLISRRTTTTIGMSL